MILQDVSHKIPSRSCHQCSCSVELAAKFCGECGASSTAILEETMPELSGYAHQVHLLATGNAEQKRTLGYSPTTEIIEHAPQFASLPKAQTADVSAELKEEMAQVLANLVREQMFLFIHCFIFLATNLVGFWLAIKAYNEYNADEGTKTLIALTPLMLINAVALTCIVPIKGTRREIAKYKEKLQYLHLKLDYRHLL